MIRASESEDPFWNSSQTNLPKPGFCANISAAISTIQPTPSDRRKPVKINGKAEGSTSLVMVLKVGSCSTRPTFIKSLSTEATPKAVLISVGQSEQRVTVTAEVIIDFGNQSIGLA